ncbi:aquaporin [Candidatus Saccharibacteria bacterium]|nr:aquaporin [Candidatus Saccharibacteria bacterium]
MATKKKGKKPAAKTASATPKAAAVTTAKGGSTTVNITEVNETVIIASPADGKVSCDPKTLFANFFKRKYENEDILTIFRSPKIIGAMLGEIIGIMLIALVWLAMGNEPIYLIFTIMFATLIAYPISGAHLNPLVTLGMMVTRRVSVVRGVFYIIAQLIGAMLAWLIIQLLIGAATSNMADSAISATQMRPITEVSQLGGLIAVEAIGAAIIGFTFARALKYKKSAFTFSAVVAGGIFTAILAALFISHRYFGITDSFAFNPAIAVALEAFMARETIVWQALITYALIPLVAGVAGFLLADVTSALAGESTGCDRKDCKC